MATENRLIEYSVVLVPTIRIVKFTIRFSTNLNPCACIVPELTIKTHDSVNNMRSLSEFFIRSTAQKLQAP